MLTYVLAKDGTPLMPTYNIRKVRKMLKDGRAVIAGHKPGFTIRLTYEGEKNTQPVEISVDTGYQTAGVSVKSEKHEFAHEEYTFLKDEKERHDTRRKHRRERRNRKWHRKPNGKDNTKPEGWIAPSLENKANLQRDICVRYSKVLPITDIYLEIGSFDTQVLAAVEKGEPVPEGTDYQHGPQYGFDTLRDAVFYRDNYTCICCGKSASKDNAIRKVHHLGCMTHDRSNRMDNLATVCSKCHTAKNHKPGGKLYDLEPKLKKLNSAAFMNAVRFRIQELVEKALSDVSVHRTYGSVTKRERLRRHLPKTHANDAYCIGTFHPKHRNRPVAYQKVRRNNRVLEKFYDARYQDVRDGEIKHASELGTNRTNRSVPRNNPQNERCFRGEKKSKGRRTIRTKRYPIPSGTVVMYRGRPYTSRGCKHYGKYVTLEGHKAVKTSDVTVLRYASGWIKTSG